MLKIDLGTFKPIEVQNFFINQSNSKYGTKECEMSQFFRIENNLSYKSIRKVHHWKLCKYLNLKSIKMM